MTSPSGPAAPKWHEHIRLWPIILLVASCKPKPMSCEVNAYYWPATSIHAGASPDLTKTGAKLPEDPPMESQPRFLEFLDSTRITMDWLGYGHFHRHFDVVFSPAEGIARTVGIPDRVYPMIRMRVGNTEFVRFAFKSRLCADLEAAEKGGYCREYQNREDLLIAEAVCAGR